MKPENLEKLAKLCKLIDAQSSGPTTSNPIEIIEDQSIPSGSNSELTGRIQPVISEAGPSTSKTTVKIEHVDVEEPSDDDEEVEEINTGFDNNPWSDINLDDVQSLSQTPASTYPLAIDQRHGAHFTKNITWQHFSYSFLKRPNFLLSTVK